MPSCSDLLDSHFAPHRRFQGSIWSIFSFPRVSTARSFRVPTAPSAWTTHVQSPPRAPNQPPVEPEDRQIAPAHDAPTNSELSLATAIIRLSIQRLSQAGLRSPSTLFLKHPGPLARRPFCSTAGPTSLSRATPTEPQPNPPSKSRSASLASFRTASAMSTPTLPKWKVAIIGA